MKTYNNLYQQIYSMGNLTIAWRKARKDKTGREDVVEFEEDLIRNLLNLHYELKNQTYKPRELRTFILQDPKTRVISISDFRDRVVHHALINVAGGIFERQFIFDSCAGQKGKGALFAVERFDKFSRKVTNNFTTCGFCLKADVKHYFQNINHEKLMGIIGRRIKDEKVIWLFWQILKNCFDEKGMPLGNYTSQFLANVYLNELDYFVKHELGVKFYIRYVDDFVLLHSSRKNIFEWMEAIEVFLIDNLRIELHKDKTHIVPLTRGTDFAGFSTC
ncbi:MAG: reverse transcriptase/maturase family protein [Nanoarchaeota archaeon]|nr:reverse transcriptase/maturase family protein [Nanoarchaeota archaeon]